MPVILTKPDRATALDTQMAEIATLAGPDTPLFALDARDPGEGAAGGEPNEEVAAVEGAHGRSLPPTNGGDNRGSRGSLSPA